MTKRKRTSTKRTLACCACATTREAAGLGGGWVEVAGQVYCKTCQKERFVLRALTFPVAECVGVEWKDFCDLVHQQWGVITSLMNWAERELAKADSVRLPVMTSIAECKLPKVYLYPEARRVFPQIEPTTITSCLQAVEKDYRSKRLATVWDYTATHDVQRYPQPIPIHNQQWTPSYDANGNPLVTFKLGRTADDKPQQVTLRLRGDDTMRRQLAGFAALMRGEGQRCEMSLYGKRSQASNPHGRFTTLRKAGGGRRRNYKIMCKLVVRIPKQIQTVRTKAMLLQTDPAAFWVAQIGTHEKTNGFIPNMQDAWILNADHIRRRAAEHLTYCAERDGRLCGASEVEALATHLDPERIKHESERHRVYLQRVAEDTKYEKRWPKRKGLQINEARENRCLKHNRCMDDWCKQVVALLIGYAVRQKVAEIHYVDDVRSYLPSFRWSDLEVKLRNACAANGIVVYPLPRERGRQNKDDAENAGQDETE